MGGNETAAAKVSAHKAWCSGLITAHFPPVTKVRGILLVVASKVQSEVKIGSRNPEVEGPNCTKCRAFHEEIVRLHTSYAS